MTNNRKKTYRKVLLSVGAGLLCFSAFAVAASSLWKKQQIEKELDARLDRRVKKISEIGMYAGQDTLLDIQAFREETKEDPSNPVYNRQTGDFVFEDASTDDPNSEPVFQVLPAMAVYLQETLVIYDDKRMSGNQDYGVYVPVIEDEDGDYIYYMDGRFVITVNGLYYGDVMLLDGVRSTSLEAFGALNDYSEENTEVKAAAAELVEKAEPNGWYKDYRYVNWVMLVGRPERANAGVLLGSWKAGEKSTDWIMSMAVSSDMVFESQNCLRYILFLDGSAELQQWRTWTIYNAIVMLVLYVLFMLILSIVLRVSMGLVRKQEVSENAASGSDDSVENTGKDREKDDSGPAPEESGVSDEGRSFGRKIPEDVARELLSYISQSEASLGPNGYLDQMRELIEKRQVRKKPGKK